ncbi:polysaccharide deacetylase family protein [Marinicrinis lubricantis]|uniref:Polysaccharide deacetylase family protein n=1 Tax=Marinicrinis lubricantis TaxID=2086470 RepID=A0ABW1IM84_9BACL
MLKRMLLLGVMLCTAAISVPFPALSVAQAAIPEMQPEDDIQASFNDENESAVLSKLKLKYPDVFIFHGNPNRKEIALTFDDAPDIRFTPQILDILKKYNVRATFFIVGTKAQKQRGLVKRIAEEQHEIGNHTYDHPFLPDLTMAEFERQIQKTHSILWNITQVHAKYIRPPYGSIKESQLLWAANHHFKIINWNVDTLDWKGISGNSVYTNVFHQIRPGSIILQHAGGGVTSDLTGTIEALPVIINTLLAKDFKFVTISELLSHR